MSTEKSFLQLVVRCTLTLLFIASFLIVLGIFNATMDWDIFGPKVEAVLFAIFWSCVVLSGCGVAITLVVGTLEISQSITALAKDQRECRDIRSGATTAWIIAVFVITALTLGGLSFANCQVQKHRTTVFKRLAKENAKTLMMRTATALTENRNKEHISRELYAALRALEGLSFVKSVTLYFPDPADNALLKAHNPKTSYKSDQSFCVILAARDYEKAVFKALSGDSSELTRMNNQADFTFYFTIFDDTPSPVGVLKIEGNSRENFREYKLGS